MPYVVGGLKSPYPAVQTATTGTSASIGVTVAAATAGETETAVAKRKGSRVGALIPAAGKGRRLGGNKPKAFVDLLGETLVQRCLRGIVDSGVVDRCVIIIPPNQGRKARELFPESICGVAISIVTGGDERADSVSAGLEALGDVDSVIVHDAARSLAPSDLISRVVCAVQDGAEAVIPVLPVVDTIKVIGEDGMVGKTLDRATLRAVQTPQGFSARVLREAHQKAMNSDILVTDDASLVEMLGYPVHVVDGDPLAFKITTPQDLLLAEALLRGSVK